MNAPAAVAAPVVEEIVTSRGLALWLVRSPGLPLVALDFAFHGGASRDPEGQMGASHLLAAMLTEGAGPYDSDAFQTALADCAIQMGFSTSADTLHGYTRCLARHREEAFALLRLALAEPRFDAPALERTRGQALASIRHNLRAPETQVDIAFYAEAFPGHPYGRRVKGTLETLPAIGRERLPALMPQLLYRKGLKLVLVADMTPAEAARLVDSAFADLPEGDDAPVPPAAIAGLGGTKLVEMDVPQTTIRFGAPGVSMQDPDYYAAVVVNHILGGSAFTSRLFQEVREKRGLAYGVWSSLVTMRSSAFQLGGTATKNERAAESIEVIRGEMKTLAANGPTAEELDAAISFITGSYPLRFDTSSKIAGEYLRVALNGDGPEFVKKRNGFYHAVTLEDAARAARRLYGDGRLLVAMAGRPAGVA